MFVGTRCNKNVHIACPRREAKPLQGLDELIAHDAPESHIGPRLGVCPVHRLMTRSSGKGQGAARMETSRAPVWENRGEGGDIWNLVETRELEVRVSISSAEQIDVTSVTARRTITP